MYRPTVFDIPRKPEHLKSANEGTANVCYRQVRHLRTLPSGRSRSGSSSFDFDFGYDVAYAVDELFSIALYFAASTTRPRRLPPDFGACILGSKRGLGRELVQIRRGATEWAHSETNL